MPRPKFRRRRLLVDRPYQLRNAFVLSGSLVVYTLILGFLIFYPLQIQLTAGATPEQQVGAADQILELHRRVWPAVLAVAILVGFQSVVMTHRVVGPIYRLKVAIAALQAGDFAHRVTLRQHDRFKEFAEALNGLAAGLQQAEVERRAWQQTLLERIARLQEGLDGLGSQGQELRGLAAALAEAAAHPPTPPPRSG